MNSLDEVRQYLTALTAWAQQMGIQRQDEQLRDSVRAKAILDFVAKQAEDEGLWLVARTAPEAYLQKELRRLHAAIEESYRG